MLSCHAKKCSYHPVLIEARVKRNFHRILIAMGSRLWNRPQYLKFKEYHTAVSIHTIEKLYAPYKSTTEWFTWSSFVARMPGRFSPHKAIMQWPKRALSMSRLWLSNNAYLLVALNCPAVFRDFVKGLDLMTMAIIHLVAEHGANYRIDSQLLVELFCNQKTIICLKHYITVSSSSI